MNRYEKWWNKERPLLARHNGKSTMDLIYLIRKLPKEQQQILFNKLKELLGDEK